MCGGGMFALDRATLLGCCIILHTRPPPRDIAASAPLAQDARTRQKQTLRGMNDTGARAKKIAGPFLLSGRYTPTSVGMNIVKTWH